MKIAMLSRHHVYHDVRIFYKETLSLRDAGHDVKLIHYPKKPIRIEERPFETLRDIKSMTQAIIDEKPDAIHCHDLDALPPGIKAKKKLKVPLLLDAHEDFPKMIMQGSRFPRGNRLLGKGWELYQKFITDHVDKVITVNGILARQFKDPLIIRNYPPRWFGDLGHDEKRITLSPNGEVTILYHGVLGEARGPEVMFKVAKEITRKHDCNFYFLGQKFGDIATPNGNHIKHLGKHGWLSVPDFLRVSDIGFCAMRPTEKYRQGLPTKLLECMAFGKPFIANEEFPLVMKLLEDTFCGAPCKYEVDQLVASLSELVEDGGLRKLLGERGRKAIVDKYNWEREAKKLVSLYESLENR